jgi:ribonuclease HII
MRIRGPPPPSLKLQVPHNVQTILWLNTIAGVDEVGRGPLAGPVVAAAVILNPDSPIIGLTDSKKLSARKREILSQKIWDQAISVSLGRAEVEEIDRLNILRASHLAMQRAVAGLRKEPSLVLVDGNLSPQFGCESTAIIKGDLKVASIGAASIVAKVSRDEEMCKLHEVHPQYGFVRHKGYGTPEHLAALKLHGRISHHRMSFAPVRTLSAE